MTIWNEQRRSVIEAVEAGAAAIDELDDPFIGPTTFDRLSYPAVQVLPESSNDNGGNEWLHQVRLNCYFERQRERAGQSNERYLDMLAAAMDAVNESLIELSATDEVLHYRPTVIEDYAGSDPGGTQLVLISTRIQASTVVDLAEET